MQQLGEGKVEQIESTHSSVKNLAVEWVEKLSASA